MAQCIVKTFDIFPYVVDKHDNIWKYTNAGYFLKVSPWESGKDRRVNRFEIEELIKKGKLIQYTAKPKLFEKLNKRWDNATHDWMHNDDIFQVALPNKNGKDFYKAPLHKFSHKYKDAQGITHEYFSEYRIVFFNGNIYWATPYHYWPQVQLYEFLSEDKEPEQKLNDYFRWTKGYHLRPIYSSKRGTYI